MQSAIKSFEVEEGNTVDMWYKITVKFHGKKVAEFLKPTMQEAKRDFQLAGYQLVAWTEGSRIVIQDQQ